MYYKVKWDNIGPEPELGNELDGLSYREALLLKYKLEKEIDNTNIKIHFKQKRRKKHGKK